MPRDGDWAWEADSMIERWSFAAAAAIGRAHAWSGSHSIVSGPTRPSPNRGICAWIRWRRNPDLSTTREAPHEPLATEIGTGQLQHRCAGTSAQADDGVGWGAQFPGAQH